MRWRGFDVLRGIFVLLGVFSFASLVWAQDVRFEEPSGIAARAGNNAAEEQNRIDWPDIRGGETGTRVVLSADLQNTDVTLYTNITYDMDRLIAEAKQIAQKMDLPRTDFIGYRGRKTTNGVDLEFNDYITKKGRTASTITLDLAALRTALESSKLSRPITLFVRIEKNDLTTATLRVPGEKDRRISETFFALQDIKDGAKIVYKTEVPLYGYVVVAVLVGIFSLMPVYLQWTVFQFNRKTRAKLRLAKEETQTILDPATVQTQYDKQKPVWTFMLTPIVMMIVFGGLMLTGNLSRGMEAGISILLSWGIPFSLAPFGIIGLFGVSYVLRFLLERAEIKREGGPIPVDTADQDTVPTWTHMAFVYPMMGAMCFMMAILLIPSLKTAVYSALPTTNGVYYLLVPVFGFAFGGAALVGYLAHRATHLELPADHYVHQVIAELTADAGVRVRKVEVVRSRALNAYVNLFRTVGFTSRLIREFSPEELRVIIAHEIGHFRAADPPRHFLIGLLTSAAIFGSWFGGIHWWEAHHTIPREAQAFLYSPIFGMFVVPLLQTLINGKTHRRAEIAADQYAVDAMEGDGEFVIQTLTKLHTGNASPHQLKPSDEALSTHPSLVNRIAAIRAYAQTQNKMFR